MTDEEFSGLFAEGTAPEHDPDFALRVAAGIGRARLGVRLRALGLRVIVVLMLSGGIFVAAGLVRPVLAQLVSGSSQFMGVPVPVVLAVLIAVLALSAWRHVLRPDAGIGFLEPID